MTVSWETNFLDKVLVGVNSADCRPGELYLLLDISVGFIYDSVMSTAD